MPRTTVHAEPILASVVGLVLGGVAGVALASTGLGAPAVVVGMAVGLAVGSSIDTARARRRGSHRSHPGGAPRPDAATPAPV